MPATLTGVRAFYLEQAMKDKKPAASEPKAPEAVPVPHINELLQDEFAGQGGSYSIDPATQKRVKNSGE